LDNGIPITPFKEDPDDCEFKHLIVHIEKCAKVEDMREVNRMIFRFSELLKYQFDSFIDYYDYIECEKIIEEDDETEMLSSTGSDSRSPKKVLSRSVSSALD
jgi:hypothetical protein